MKIVKCMRFLIRLLTPDLEDEPLTPFWIADGWRSALLDPYSGRLLAQIWHDGCGKYYPALYLSPLKALLVSKLCISVATWLAPFPLIRLDLLRLKASSLRDAQAAVEALL